MSAQLRARSGIALPTCPGVGGRAHLARWAVSLGLLAGLGCMACSAAPRNPPRPPIRDAVLVTEARCAGVHSCVVGYISAAESERPLSNASVWFEREDASEGEGEMFGATTDFEGVFVVVDPPPGRYTIGVYRGARRKQFHGVELGAPGTRVAVISLAPH